MFESACALGPGSAYGTERLGGEGLLKSGPHRGFPDPDFASPGETIRHRHSPATGAEEQEYRRPRATPQSSSIPIKLNIFIMYIIYIIRVKGNLGNSSPKWLY